LHAHLNGSLSNSTLEKLIQLKKKTQGTFDASNVKVYNTFDANDSLEECFAKFKLAHELVDSTDAVKLAMKCVIDEFAKENVVYVEMRSTPRATATMSKEEYLEAIIEQIM
jgi:adenosine deaminase